jgi:hypothetical protein
MANNASITYKGYFIYRQPGTPRHQPAWAIHLGGLSGKLVGKAWSKSKAKRAIDAAPDGL